MGTNYYLKLNVRPCCKREEKYIHIGKSSAGWCFSLRVYPEDKINDLPDWAALFNNPKATIEDEYHASITPQEMLGIITKRSWKRKAAIPCGYASLESFWELNHAQQGPNGLSRHRLDGHRCIKHGAGTWDCIVGEFS